MAPLHGVKTGIFCAQGFGDALIQMVLANNFARQGYDVTFYSDIAAPFDKIVSAYRICSFPDYDEVLQQVKDTPVVLYDSSGKFTRNMPDPVSDWFERNAICYRMSNAVPRHTLVSEPDIAKRLPPESQDRAAQLIKFNRALRNQSGLSDRPPVVAQLANFLEKEIGFSSVTRQNGLPTDRSTVAENKIVIHPTSSNPRKNWNPDRYVELAHRLEKSGFRPVFTVSPAEREDWMSRVNNLFDVPLFETVAELASFYTDAYYFIGGDSGNAHLASSLGVPTLQLFRGRKKAPPWRAGWSNNTVLLARFPFTLNRNIWQKGMSVERVMRTFEKLQSRSRPST